MTDGESTSGPFDELEPGRELNATTVRAIEAFKLLTMTAPGRRAFLAEPPDQKQRAFDKLFDPGRFEEEDRLPEYQTNLEPVRELRERGDVTYDQIPGGVRDVLERLSGSELAFLADLDAAYVKAGMYLGSNPGGSHVH